MPLRYLCSTAALMLCVVGCEPVEADDVTEPATLSEIEEQIFKISCKNSACHSDGTGARGLILVDDDVHSLLVDVDASDETNGDGDSWKLVVPGDPDASLLYIAVKEGLGDNVRQMPPGVPLSDDKIDMIRTWIVNGAPDN